MRLLIRVLLVFFVISALLSIVRGLLSPKNTEKRRQARGKPALGGRLIKDPVCGTYVAESTALQSGENYFCSEDCRQKFIATET